MSDRAERPWAPVVLGAIAWGFLWLIAGAAGVVDVDYPALACDPGGVRAAQDLLFAGGRAGLDAAIAACAGAGGGDAWDMGRAVGRSVERDVWFDTLLLVPAYGTLLLLGAWVLRERRGPALFAVLATATACAADLAENAALLFAVVEVPEGWTVAQWLALGAGAMQVKWLGIALAAGALTVGTFGRARLAAVPAAVTAAGALVALGGATTRDTAMVAGGGGVAVLGLALLPLVIAGLGPWGAGASAARRVGAALAGGLLLALPLTVVLGWRLENAVDVGRYVPAGVCVALLGAGAVWRRVITGGFGRPPGADNLVGLAAVTLALGPEVHEAGGDEPSVLPWAARAVFLAGLGLAWGCLRHGVPTKETRWHALSHRGVSAGVLALFPSVLQALGPAAMICVSVAFTLVGAPAPLPHDQGGELAIAGALETLLLVPWAWVPVVYARSALRDYAAPRAEAAPGPRDGEWIAASRQARAALSPGSSPPGGPPLGLALSGGGIRATSFAAGALAAAESAGLLRRVDVLSVVSGGSWAGVGWWLEARDRDATVPVARWAAAADYLGIAGRPLRALGHVVRPLAWNVALLLVVFGAAAMWVTDVVVGLLLASMSERIPKLEPPDAWLDLPVLGWLLEAVPAQSEGMLEAAPYLAWAVAVAVGWTVLSASGGAAGVARALRPLGLLIALWGVVAAVRLGGVALVAVVLASGTEWELRRRGWRTGMGRTVAGVFWAGVVGAVALAGERGVSYATSFTDWVGAGAADGLGWGVLAVLGGGEYGVFVVLLGAPLALAAAFALRGGPDRARTSLHGSWSAAIGRAFLGDAANRPLAEVFTTPDHRPLLVIGTSANVPGTADPALAERHTAPLDMTPTGIGGPALGWAPPAAYPITIGEAVALSSAAVSSQMGAMLPRAVVSVFATLNLQLGRWLPGPRRAPAAGPADGWLPMLFAELAWDGDERDPVLFVTDGGHDDNTGVLALVRRGCRHVVLADAEADPFTRAGPWHPQLRGLLARLQAEGGYTLASAGFGPDGMGAPAPLDALLDDGAWRGGHPTSALAFTLERPRDTPHTLDGAPERVDLLVLRLARPATLPRAAAPFAADEDFPAWDTADQGYTPERFAALAALGEAHAATLFAWGRAHGLLPTPAPEAEPSRAAG